MNDLWAHFLANPGRGIHKWTHYFPAYERHFARFRQQAVTLVEIGCGAGGSLQMWRRYFGPHARIVGLDINPACAAFEEDGIFVRIGGQSDTGFLDAVMAEFGPVQIIIDDGSHKMADVAASFAHLYLHPAFDVCGVYLIEDLHTAYWPEYGGGYRHRDSFIETAKAHVDELNAWHTRGAVTPGPFAAATLSVHFYDSIVVYERGRRTQSRSLFSDREGVR